MRRFLKIGWYTVLASIAILKIAGAPESVGRAREALPVWESALSWANSHDVFWWGALGVLALGSIAFDVAPFVRRRWKGWFGDHLEILYDPKDPDSRYAMVDVWYNFNSTEGFPALILRIGVRNNTNKTIREVSGTIEGPIGDFLVPKSLRFSRTRELSGNLHPKSMELMDLMGIVEAPKDWPFPDGKHKFTVRIRGQDCDEVSQDFVMDKSKVPPLNIEKN